VNIFKIDCVLKGGRDRLRLENGGQERFDERGGDAIVVHGGNGVCSVSIIGGLDPELTDQIKGSGAVGRAVGRDDTALR